MAFNCAIMDSTPKELGELSTAHSEVSEMLMKSVKMPLHLKTGEMEKKKRTWWRVQ
jgi:hypothetical protein